MAGFEATTGFLRAYKVQITQTMGSITLTPSVSMLPAIPGTNFATLTEPEFQRISRTEYEARRTAFIGYLQATYSGLMISAEGSIIADTEEAHIINS